MLRRILVRSVLIIASATPLTILLAWFLAARAALTPAENVLAVIPTDRGDTWSIIVSLEGPGTRVLRLGMIVPGDPSVNPNRPPDVFGLPATIEVDRVAGHHLRLGAGPSDALLAEQVAGWPMYALWSPLERSEFDKRLAGLGAPFGSIGPSPIWTGFAVDVLLFSSMIALTWWRPTS